MPFERASLASRTTLGVGGEAVVAECRTEEDVRTALAHARESRLPFWVLGEGSNTLARDEGYGGIVIRPMMDDVSFEDTLLIAGAGAHWDALVDAACARGLWGIEHLAGIPGSAGAAPVQNIGAYGAELSDTLRWVEYIDARDGALQRIAAADCGLAYRESRFKRERDLVIVRIALALRADAARGSRQAAGGVRGAMEAGAAPPAPRAEYADIAKARAEGARLDTPADVAAVVRTIRAAKFPDLAEEGTAGSFFKNPVIAQPAFDALRAKYPGLPGYPAAPGLVKVPLAYVLDRVLGLRGYRRGPARLFEAQPLVLVADRGAHARDVDALADEIAQRVSDATGIAIEREVRVLA